MNSQEKHVLDETALSWANRCLWALCITVYLTVFVGGVLASGDELLTMGRAVGLTLATGVLGKIAVGLLARATLPEEKGPTAVPAGPLGSQGDAASSTNVAEHEDTALAA